MKGFRLRVPGHGFEFEPGQHTTVRFDDFGDRDFYVCGVPAMVVDAEERLRGLGAPEERIHSEGWEDGVVDEG